MADFGLNNFQSNLDKRTKRIAEAAIHPRWDIPGFLTVNQ
jgi:hypothetical protein